MLTDVWKGSRLATLLGITSFFLLATEVLQWDLTLTTGLSAKNLLIYLLATFLALRMVVARTSILDGGHLQAAWIALIGYAMFTWLIAGLVIEYPGYDWIASAIRLKSGLIDYFIFFLVFLFGVRSADDATTVIKWLLFGALFANLATILDNAGLVNLGFQERMDGRTQGAMGESNQYAAYIILFIPGMIGAAVLARGMRRLFWLGATLVSCAALALTASRGGILGLVLACGIGAWLYRHRVSYGRAAGWIVGSLAVFAVIMSFSQAGGLLTERVFGQTSNIDAVEASSGRTEIWINLFMTMLRQPVTFLSGFGWDVYWSFPFRFSPHNHYFSLWFNLGLVGLIAGGYLLFSPVVRAWRASLVADARLRPQLAGFVIGALAVCGAVFFVELHDPWVYFWMYTGTVMRMVLCVEPVESTQPQRMEPRRPRMTGGLRDAYGWVGRRQT